MRRRLLAGVVVAAAAALASAGPALAHGDHDARPLARHLEAGPFIVSLWQVYPDSGAGMTPNLIVLFDDGTASATASVAVLVDSRPVGVRPSTTTADGWETTESLAEGAVVAVTISDGAQSWQLAPVVVPPPPTSLIPMTELIYVSIFLTAATGVWVARRTTRAWRHPVVRPSPAT